MKNFRLFLLVLILTSLSAIAAPQPIPPPKPTLPTSLSVTQGLVIRTLTVPNAACARYTDTPDANGSRIITLAQPDGRGGVKPCAANGSYLRVSQADGPIWPQWIYTAAAPVCVPPTLPGPVVTTKQCADTNPGTTGSWQQTATYALASPQVPPDGCYVLGAPLPTVAPPGACSTPPPSQWVAPRFIGSGAIPAKPAKGASVVGPYGFPITRVTDHTTDTSGQPWIVSWYNRFQAYNADGSMFLAYESDGFWLAYDANTNAVIRKLQGPAADAEIQWSVTEPDFFRYLPTNGGRVLRKMNARTGAVVVDWDFTAAVAPIFPNATRYWTKSEGSPTADGRFWCLWAESDDFTKVFGYVKLDIVNRVVAWSMPNPHGTAVTDNVGCTPSGRWLVDSGTQTGIHTTAYATDGSGRTQQLSLLTEHGELGVRSDGHDFYIGPDYTAGVMYTIDVDTGIRRDLFPIYNNPYLGNNGDCKNCAVHPSAKAFGKPGWAVVSTFGTPPANILLVNVEDGRVFGLGADYANVPDSSYWPEPHCTVDHNLTRMLCSDNFKNTTTPLDVDAYRTDLPPLPSASQPGFVMAAPARNAIIQAPKRPAITFTKKPGLSN